MFFDFYGISPLNWLIYYECEYPRLVLYGVFWLWEWKVRGGGGDRWAGGQVDNRRMKREKKNMVRVVGYSKALSNL